MPKEQRSVRSTMNDRTTLGNMYLRVSVDSWFDLEQLTLAPPRTSYAAPVDTYTGKHIEIRQGIEYS